MWSATTSLGPIGSTVLMLIHKQTEKIKTDKDLKPQPRFENALNTKFQARIWKFFDIPNFLFSESYLKIPQINLFLKVSPQNVSFYPVFLGFFTSSFC